LILVYEADQDVYLVYSLVQKKNKSQILGTLPQYLANIFAKKNLSNAILSLILVHVQQLNKLCLSITIQFTSIT